MRGLALAQLGNENMSKKSCEEKTKLDVGIWHQLKYVVSLPSIPLFSIGSQEENEHHYSQTQHVAMN